MEYKIDIQRRTERVWTKDKYLYDASKVECFRAI